MDSAAVPEDLWWWRHETAGLRAAFTRSSATVQSSFGVPEERATEPPGTWRILADAFASQSLVVGEQVHGAQAAIVGSPLAREWLVLPGTDAVVSATPGVLVAVRVADCVPILLWEEGRVVAAVHAGWRGLRGGVVASALAAVERVGVSPTELHAALGPAIGGCCYEVGADVADALRGLPGGESAVALRGDSWYADLPSLAVAQLSAGGVSARRIALATACTFCHPDRFFSYRRDGASAGRQVGAIMLVGE